MTLKKIFSIALFSTLLTSIVNAETEMMPEPNASEFASTSSPHTLFFGVEGFHYRYDEKIPPNNSHLMDFRGMMLGLTTGYTYEFSNLIFMGFDLRASFGEVDYRGGVQNLNGSTQAATAKRIEQGLFETRFRVGKKFRAGNGFHLSPFTGIGYRLKSDFSGKKIFTAADSTRVYGYNRMSHYVYLPLGVIIDKELTQDWFVAVTGEIDFLISGRQWSHVSLYSRGVIHKQKRGFGLKADIVVSKKINNKIISIGPFVNYWNIKDSNIVRERFVNPVTGKPFHSMEPRNTTTEVGLALKIKL